MDTVCPVCGAEMETITSVDYESREYCQDHCVRCDYISAEYFPDPDSDDDA